MNQIRYFVALGETLNFTRVAEQCNVTQPALTRAIHMLEEELGGELLRRERSLSHLTELGERVLPIMRKCHESALAAKSLAQSVKRGGVAPLSLALSHTIHAGLVAPKLQELTRALPGLQLKLYRSSGPGVAELLKSGEAELAVAGPLEQQWDRFDEFPLFEEPFELVFGRAHRFSGRKSVARQELAEERIVRLTHCEFDEGAADVIEVLRVESPRVHEVATETDLIALLESAFGVAVVPANVARSERLYRLPLQGAATRTVSAYCVAGRQRSAAGATLLNLLRAGDWSSVGQVPGARR
ncbi:MAG: LysR family transcriptional regulator [Dongiaceae bacterium]